MSWLFRRRDAASAVILAVAVLVSLTVAVGGSRAVAAEPPPVIEIGTAVNIDIIDATSRTVADGGGLQPPGTSEPQYVPADLVTDTSWTTEAATVPDRTTDPRVNRVTPRTAVMVDAAIAGGLTRLGSVSCVGGRSENPNSDHPGGRACDLFFNPNTQVSAGWRAADWLVANQAALGVKYVIWQGLIWNARSKPGPWTTYVSSAYGCPNPANLTGCHYDHVHVSMY